MIEGYAMMIEDNYDDNDLHYMAALAYKNGFNFPLLDLFSGLKFFMQTSSVSYIFAGSFIKYLKERFGIEKVNSFYGDLNFETHFGINFTELEKDYYLYLDHLNYIQNKNEAVLYYGRKPIFKRTCARYVANQLKRGWEKYNKGAFGDAEGIFKNLFKYSETYYALIGYTNSLIKIDSIDLARKTLNEEFEKYENTSYFFNLQLIYADVLVRCGENSKALDLYNSILSENPNIDYNILARSRVIIQSESIDVLKKYLLGSQYDKYVTVGSLIERKSNPYIIPIFISLSSDLNEDYSDFIHKVDSHFTINDKVSAYAAIKLSRYTIENGDLIKAKHYAEQALKYPIEQKRNAYKENLKKILWMIENQEDVRTKLVYTFQ